MAVQLILKNSTVEDRRPTAAQLANGELSINFNEAGPFLCCKDTAGNIQQLGGIKFNPDVPADAVSGTWWWNTATETLYVYDGIVWKEVGGGGGGGSGITQILGDDGIDATVIGTVVTLNVDIEPDKGLYFELDKIAINAGANISFDADGKIQADIDTLSYKGTIDLTSDPVPAGRSAGDAFANTASGAMSAAWQAATGLGATTVIPGDLVVKTPSAWSYIPTGGVSSTDLGIDNRGIETLDVTSSTGTNATIPAATDALAGLMTAADKATLDAGTDLGIDNRGIETLDITSSTGDDVTIPAATDALAGLMTAADKTTLDSGGTPNGGTGDRPVAPEIGDLYFDTDLDLLLVWNGTDWEPVSPPAEPGQWQRNGTKLTPVNDGDTVAVTAADGTENITLNADGSIVAVADATINSVTVGLGGGSVVDNTAVGSGALPSNTTGTENTAVGLGALSANTEGNRNTAVGRSALNKNTTGNGNTAVGRSALRENTEGTENTAVGRTALQENTTGVGNVAVGYNALQDNTEGEFNTALGYFALLENITGDNNTAVGRSALTNNTAGESNTAIGLNSGFYIEGDNNTILGAYQGTAADATLSDTVIISAGTSEKLRIDSTGSLLFGGTLPSSPNISLNADGTASFAGDVTANSFVGTMPLDLDTLPELV